jgi:anti-sigma factor RsiW
LLPDLSVELLDSRLRREVTAHLDACELCSRELRELESVVCLVERYGSVEPPPGLFNAVRNRIESGEVRRERPFWWAWMYSRPARAAAMGLATGAVVLGLVVPAGPPPIPSPSIHPEPAGTVSTALASSIRQHAISASEGPLTDRVAWEAMAQLASLDGEPASSEDTDAVE